MKKLFFLILVLIPFISSCQKDDVVSPDSQIREIAWNALDAQQQATVNIDWQQAPVTESTYNQEIVYVVRFNTTEDPLLGPIEVYIDKSTKAVLGQALRM